MNASWGRLSELGANLRQGGALEQRQASWLLACLSRNANTSYGNRLGFAGIRSVEDFQRLVPLVTYEDLLPWITRSGQGESGVLFDGPALAFERTGGSMSGAKLLPYSARSLEDFRVAILPWLHDIIDRFGLTRGCAYWAISPATRQPESTPGGIPVGVTDAAYLGSEAVPAFVALSAVDPDIGAVADVRDWQLLTLHALVRRVDLALISVWSPTFFLNLVGALEARADEIEKLLAEGGAVANQQAQADEQALARFRAYRDNPSTNLLWPRLALVSCWADGDSRPYYDLLRTRLPHAQFQAKGLLATEGVVTVPDAEGRPVLAGDSGFFEFLDVAGRCLLPGELRAGERYEVVMTTSGGLYRYRIGDLVECEASHGAAGPVLRFIGRAGLSSDLVGEKLSEQFVAECLASLTGFRMLVRAAGPQPGYALVVDRLQVGEAADLAEVVERRLSVNPQYEYARRMGQLRPLSVYCVEDPLNRYVHHAMGARARMGDLKIPVLRREGGLLDIFLGSAQ